MVGYRIVTVTRNSGGSVWDWLPRGVPDTTNGSAQLRPPSVGMYCCGDGRRRGVLWVAGLLAGLALSSALADTQAFPVPLTALAPTGCLVYAGSTTGALAVTGTSETYTIALDGGQTLTARAQPLTGTLRPALSLTTVDGMAGVVTASVAGATAVLRTIAVPHAGTCTLRVDGASNSTGTFALAILLNAAEEEETYGGVNGSTATAQDISGSGFTLTPRSSRLAVRGKLAQAAPGIVVEERFTSNTLGSAWQWYASDSGGRLFVTAAYGVQAGPYALWLDRAPTGAYTLNEAVWTVDLSGLSAAELRFFQAEWEDEENSMPRDSFGVFTDFVGHATADGVAISDDGTRWHTVYSPTNQSDAAWSEVVVDLAAQAAAAGMTLSTNFQIKFQQYDDFPLKSDGRGYDEITITTPSADQDWYRFHLAAGDLTSLKLTGPSDTNVTLRLLATDGITQLATDPGTGQVGRLIERYVAPSNGVFYAVISGTNADYLMQIGRNALLKRESNGSIATAQNMDGVEAALGHVGGAADEADHFVFTVASGQVIVATTRTPAGGPYEFQNSMDPTVTLLSPNGSVLVAADNSPPDFRNVSIVTTAEVAGVYGARISATNATSGEYIFRLAVVGPTDDSDADGLPDTWEIAHGLDPHDDGSILRVNGPQGDLDHDGVPNFTEYQTGTAPDDARSVLAITSVRANSATNFMEITAATEPGRIYTIQFTDDGLMKPPVWTNFTNPGNGIGSWQETSAFRSVHAFRDDFTTNTTGAAPTNHPRAYRIRMSQP